MYRFKIGLLIVGAVLGFMGYQEWRLSGKAKSEPQTLTCRDLIEKGYGDNANVIVNGFGFSESFVYETNKGQTTWNRVWIPMVPLEELGRTGKDGRSTPPDKKDMKVRLILKSSHVGTQAGLTDLASATGIEGLIINEIAKLTGKEKALLQEEYPATDFSSCYILEHGRTPASGGKVLGLLGGSAGCLAVGLVWVLAGLRKKAAAQLAGPTLPGAPPLPAAPPAEPPADSQAKANPYAGDQMR